MAKLDFDPATQAELEASGAGLANAGTLNRSANPVAWTKLKGVPTEIADGSDQIFGFVDLESASLTPDVGDLSVLSVNYPSPVTISDLTGATAGEGRWSP